MAATSINDLRLTLIPGNRTVTYRRRGKGSVFDDKVMARAIAYRTYVVEEDGKTAIYTEVLTEDRAGVQEFVALRNLIWMKRATDIDAPPPKATVPEDGF